MTLEQIVHDLTGNETLLSALAALVAIALFLWAPVRVFFRAIFVFVRSRFWNSQKKIRLTTRKQYMEELARLLEINRRQYRAVIVGPLFLHPNWVIERRNAMSATTSYDDKLLTFILAHSQKRNHNIRIILANRARYRTKVDKLVLEAERPKFIADMLQAIDLVWGVNAEKGPDLVCSDVGHFRIDVIFDNALVTAARLSPDRPLSGGLLSYSADEVQAQSELFDQVFDELSGGNAREVQKLKDFVTNLWAE